MRVGPVGWAFETREEVLEAAKKSAECTHNHPEGIKGAQAIALCVFMARKGFSKEDIRKEIEKTFHYDLNFTCDGIRDTYQWGGTCQESVPQAIVAFLDGEDFEDCIRNAISIGGDSDTIGCITGSIAEAYYGVPEEIREVALGYIPEEFKIINVRGEEIKSSLLEITTEDSKIAIDMIAFQADVLPVKSFDISFGHQDIEIAKSRVVLCQKDQVIIYAPSRSGRVLVKP